MENASKALLIAGAILIVILLIAVGMLVYSQSRGTIDTGVAQMSSAEIQMFNSQFTNYEGKQNLAAIKTLLQIIKNNNETYKDDKSKWVYCKMYVEYINNGVKTYSSKGHALSVIEKGRYDSEYLNEDFNQINEYLNESTSNKNFNVYIYHDKFSKSGLVDYIKIIQVGAENYAATDE